MDKQFLTFCKNLESKIKNAYEGGTTLEEAERLAAEFLHAQMIVGEELQKSDLDARMKKAGLKAIKAQVYLESATKGDRKPSDTLIGAVVDSDSIVQESQRLFDEAEAQKNYLETYLNVFRESHIFFRGVSRGRFE